MSHAHPNLASIFLRISFGEIVVGSAVLRSNARTAFPTLTASTTSFADGSAATPSALRGGKGDQFW